jgi:predicted dehydrogenase
MGGPGKSGGITGNPGNTMTVTIEPAASGISRRTFVKTTVAGVSALSAGRVLGANERINVGLIGFGLIGRFHLAALKEQPDVQVTAVCDAHRGRTDAAAEMAGTNPARYADFRKLLADKNVDAVYIATPDHWHALMTMMACAAGKDVYVEKPLTLFVREGRWMLEVARRTKRVVQVGTQNRSGPPFQKARELIREGRLGQIVSASNNNSRNVSPGWGNPPDGAPPPELDYDMFLGPAPKRPYNPNRSIYHFRWFWDYSGGQATNLGQHSLDLVHWMLGVRAPKSVYSAGGRWFLKDNCEVPDTQDVIMEYPEFTVTCQYREATAGRGGLGMGGLTFFGTKGCLPISRSGFELCADPKANPNNMVASILGVKGHPVGGPQLEPEEKGQLWTTPGQDNSGDAIKDYARHARNFLDCVKSRKEPVSDLQSGHEIATACHLSNLSLRTGRKLVWDAEKEEIVGDREANAMLVRPYRAPWDAEWRALGVKA